MRMKKKAKSHNAPTETVLVEHSHPNPWHLKEGECDMELWHLNRLTVDEFGYLVLESHMYDFDSESEEAYIHPDGFSERIEEMIISEKYDIRIEAVDSPNSSEHGWTINISYKELKVPDNIKSEIKGKWNEKEEK